MRAQPQRPGVKQRKARDLRFQGLVICEPVADVTRARCACGDGVWWRRSQREPWHCRTCRPVAAKAKVFWIRRKRNMVDPTTHEIAAIQAASEPAGEYLEELGKTDLATLEEHEWLTFLEVVITAYQSKLAELTAA